MSERPSRGYTPSAYGLLHYRDQGSGPTILLLHQTAWSSVQFEGVQAELSRAGFRSIAIDTPGYGMSDGPDMCPTIEEYAAAILQGLDHLDLDKVFVAGHHTGSVIGCALANAANVKPPVARPSWKPLSSR